jgi:hypothetical protein
MEVSQLQPFCPIPFMQIHEHRLLQLCLPIVYRDRVIMPVQPMDESLYRRFVDMAYVGRCLTGFTTRKHRVGVDEPERINDDFAFDGLNGVYNDSHRARV